MSNKFGLGDFLKAINKTKEPLMDGATPEQVKSYPPFVINRCMSYFPDTIFYANEMNQVCSDVSEKMQFDYFLNIVRERYRFSKWIKPDELSDLDVIKEAYNFSDRKAREALPLLSADQINSLRKKQEKGGLVKNDRNKREKSGGDSS